VVAARETGDGQDDYLASLGSGPRSVTVAKALPVAPKRRALLAELQEMRLGEVVIFQGQLRRWIANRTSTPAPESETPFDD
jgi:hypothetical protein